jgi:hypothetical protein
MAASRFSSEATVPLSNSAPCLIDVAAWTDRASPAKSRIAISFPAAVWRLDDGFQQLDGGVDGTSDFGHSPGHFKFGWVHMVRLA